VASGLRFKATLLKNIGYSAEAIRGRGTDDPNSTDDWTTTFGAGYRIGQLCSKPRFFGQYDYAAATRIPQTGRNPYVSQDRRPDTVENWRTKAGTGEGGRMEGILTSRINGATVFRQRRGDTGHGCAAPEKTDRIIRT
jgi:hypothetical protein